MRDVFLINGAIEMNELYRKTCELIHEHRQVLACSAVDYQYKRQEKFWGKWGESGRDLSIRDVNYHFSYLIESIRNQDFMLFVRYSEWLKELFAGLGFPDDTVKITFECMRAALKERLPENFFKMADSHLKKGIEQVQKPSNGSHTYLDRSDPLYSLAKEYMEVLLAGQKQTAIRLVLDAVDNGVEIKDIYLWVFQNCQYEIGRLWHLNKISVAQEHYCSAVTQLIMSQLYSHIFSSDKIGRRLMAACVHSELHEIGIRMVSDFFELAGWDTYYLGANTPDNSIIQALDKKKPDILALSATMPFHLDSLRRTILNVRNSAPKGIKIIVGGFALNSSENLWEKVGADGYAGDAEGAVSLAQDLLDKR